MLAARNVHVSPRLTQCWWSREFVRIILEELGLEYSDVGREKSYSDVIKVLRDELGGDFPTTAPPAIKRGDFVLCQTPVICEFLGRKYGLYPDGEADIAHASQLNMMVTGALCSSGGWHGAALEAPLTPRLCWCV